MSDPFLQLVRSRWARVDILPPEKTGHSQRKHSKYSASGAERWFNCPASVGLSEGMPDKDSVWSIEGTLAHEVLEAILLVLLKIDPYEKHEAFFRRVPPQMISHAKAAAKFILKLFVNTPNSEVMVETKIFLDFIHPEMFGTFDGAVIDFFGTLHVFDYKYGAGHPVSVKKNLQMIFYGLGLAAKYHWNFKRVRLWIIQPRIRGYDGPTFWEISTKELRDYVAEFRKAVKRVEREPDNFQEGSWCHWCKAKAKCPLKRRDKLEKAQLLFGVPK